MDLSFKRIQSNPEVLNGKPCIKGTRISVQMVLEWLSSGASAADIEKRHPQIEKEDVLEALRFASKFARNDLFFELKID